MLVCPGNNANFYRDKTKYFGVPRMTVVNYHMTGITAPMYMLTSVSRMELFGSPDEVYFKALKLQ